MNSTGLSSREAEERLLVYGHNIITRSVRKTPWLLLLEQFKSPLVVILLVACGLSFGLKEWAEGLAIALILIINALIGFFQEYRAETAVQALMEMTAPKARVLRDGRQKDIEASQVVPGDILILERGDIVTADGKVTQAARLQLNEAVLTGESIPVQKNPNGDTDSKDLMERDGYVYMGTSVFSGTAKIEVATTGMKTELGRIAHLINTAQETSTPLQDQIAKVGKMLLVICLLVVSLVFVIGIFQNKPWTELVIFALSLAVAAVPEGMPAIVTVALAFGVQRMAAKNALIRKLPSVETLGSVSVICTDKTGTLTTGLMRVRELWGVNHEEILRVGASCCDAELGETRDTDVGDPTEIAILLAAFERGIEKEKIEIDNPRVNVEPFDSERKRMSIARTDGRIYVKGAFESVHPLCVTTKEAESAVEDLSSRGLRVLAVAVGNGTEEKNLTFVGLLGIADPPRSEAVFSISEAKEAGILPIMITGDHPSTALAIGRELGLISKNEASEGKIYSRATPEDKIKIVRRWKEKGAIVAMTGDGVNDAPALREAHIGIAMGKTGTQVTREAADLVLADDNFATIIAAVREGRGVYQNIRKAIVYLLTGNFAELAIVLGASILSLPVPFLAPHLLWINLVTDALPGLALIADPTPENVMKQKPRQKSEHILGRAQWSQIVIIGLIETLSIGLLYWIQLKENGPEQARNLSFTALVSSQIFRSLSARSKIKTYWQVGVLNNLWLVGVIILTFFLQISLHFIPIGQRIFGLRPIGFNDLVWIISFSLTTVSVVELFKLMLHIFSKKKRLSV